MVMVQWYQLRINIYNVLPFFTNINFTSVAHSGFNKNFTSNYETACFDPEEIISLK